MQTISDIFNTKVTQKSNIKSQRAEILKQFIDELTLERRYENFRRYRGLNRVRCSKREMPLTPEQFKKHPFFLKPLKPSYIGFKLSHMKDTSDLYYLLSICRDAKKRGTPFSKVFFGSIKVKA